MKKTKKPTSPNPLLSCGTTEKKILSYIKNNDDRYFNRSKCARVLGKAKSTIKQALDNLVKKGFLESEKIGRNYTDYKLTKKGRVSADGVGTNRCIYRQSPKNLSTHYHKYKCRIKENNIKDIESLRKSLDAEVSTNDNMGWKQIIIRW